MLRLTIWSHPPQAQQIYSRIRVLTLGSNLPGKMSAGPEGMHFIKWSKTNQMGRCVQRTKGRHICPVPAMEAYRACCNCSTHSSPLFHFKDGRTLTSKSFCSTFLSLLGGLGIPDPTTTSDTEYTASRSVCKPLYNLILLHDSSYPTEAIEQQVEAKKEVHSLKLKHSQGSAFNLRPQLANSTQRSMDLAQEKGASNWLTTLPIDENGFTLHKVEHALSCPLGGFPSIRHNEIHDLTANLMTEVCHNVSIEPHLQPITGGMGSIATTTYKRLASLLADKWGTSYSQTWGGFVAVYPSLF
eukprot:Em0014g506a